MTKIVKCENPRCASAFQDEHYGKGNRVMNLSLKGGEGDAVYVCTACATKNSLIARDDERVEKRQRMAAKSGGGGRERSWYERPEVTRTRFLKMKLGIKV